MTAPKHSAVSRAVWKIADALAWASWAIDRTRFHLERCEREWRDRRVDES